MVAFLVPRLLPLACLRNAVLCDTCSLDVLFLCSVTHTKLRTARFIIPCQVADGRFWHENRAGLKRCRKSSYHRCWSLGPRCDNRVGLRRGIIFRGYRHSRSYDQLQSNLREFSLTVKSKLLIISKFRRLGYPDS